MVANPNVHIDYWGPFNWHRLTLISVWITNHSPSKVCDAIPYPLQNYIMIVISYPWWDQKGVREFACIFMSHTKYLIKIDKFDKSMPAKCMT